MTEVRLVDLEVIKRFSLALRQEFADAEDVLDALDASREVVMDALGGDGAPRRVLVTRPSGSSRPAPLKASRQPARKAATKRTPVRKAATRRAPAKKTTSRASTAKKTTAKRAAAKKATSRASSTARRATSARKPVAKKAAAKRTTRTTAKKAAKRRR